MSNGDMTMTLFGRVHLDAWAFPNTSDSVDVFETGRIDGSDAYRFSGLEGVANWGPTQVAAELQGIQVERVAPAGRPIRPRAEAGSKRK